MKYDEHGDIRSPELPFVSVIIPCRNEAKHIDACIESVMACDYPRERLEVLVIDGMSDDGTRPLLEAIARRHTAIRVLDNPKRTAPAALNIGVAAARGAVIMRMDAHNKYPSTYISMLVHWLEKSGADNVGGVWVTRPSSERAMARAIALGCSHPFGVGNSRFRLTVEKPCQVDTVPFGCYRRDVFDRIGMFDEELVRNQDIEFNLRLRNSGGSILLVPEVASYYHARDTLRELWRTHYQNGYFNMLVVRKMKGAHHIQAGDSAVVCPDAVDDRPAVAVFRLDAGRVSLRCRGLCHTPGREFADRSLAIRLANRRVARHGVCDVAFQHRNWLVEGGH